MDWKKKLHPNNIGLKVKLNKDSDKPMWRVGLDYDMVHEIIRWDFVAEEGIHLKNTFGSLWIMDFPFFKEHFIFI